VSRTSRGYAFGLEVESAFPIPVAAPSLNGSPRRATSLELVSKEELAKAWPAGGAVSVLERRDPHGRLVMSIDRHEAAGYLISAPRYGRHLVSADGRELRSALPNVAPWRCHRLLFAQVLPLAATLQGLELFHASAVAIEGRAYGFIAPSGTGKTSVAAHLVSRGATFVTDDVMALEPYGDGIHVHPGGGMASVHADELRSVPAELLSRLGEVVGRSDKVQLAIELVDCALPLAAIYFLERNGLAGRLVVEPIAPPDPRLLLSSSFISYIETPAHLLQHLDVCARVAESVAMFQVRIPASVPARDVAAALAAQLSALG
jgi:hypothetical protein